MLQVNKVSKHYADHTALNGVSLSVEKSQVFGLLGPNGAGKTSLIRIINQITAPDSGEVFLKGEALKREHISMIGYLPEERGLYKKMKIGEQCLYLAQLKGMGQLEAKKRLKSWFERFEIGSWWGKKVEDLSKGMAQKVQFITTVIHDPELLILDEPFSGFDPINTQLIREEILRLRDEGATVILSTHNMGSVEEICDNIALINKSNKVLDGSVSQIKKDFSKNVYEVAFEGTMLEFTNALGHRFELLEKETKGDHHVCMVKLGEGMHLNNLMGAVLPAVQIESANEIIPTMSDIFIDVVQKIHKGGEHE